MNQTNSLQQSIQQMLLQADRIAITTHIRPDGDAIGSMLGFGLALQDAGKDVQMILKDPVPPSFHHLKGAKQILSAADHDFGLFIVVDCSDLQRTGAIIPDRTPDLVIDHHITNLNFGKLNLVEPDSVATAAILANYLEQWGFPIQQSSAEALLTGIITDSLGFRTSNMNAQALRLAANLVDKGADISYLYQKALMLRSYEAVRFWGIGLSEIQRAGRLVWTTLTMQGRADAGYSGKDDADLINVLATIEDADVSLIFVETKNEHVKVSWRAQPGFDISGIALQFGGGGHPAAAGAEIPGSLEEVREKVINATQAYLSQTSPTKK